MGVACNYKYPEGYFKCRKKNIFLKARFFEVAKIAKKNYTFFLNLLAWKPSLNIPYNILESNSLL